MFLLMPHFSIKLVESVTMMLFLFVRVKFREMLRSINPPENEEESGVMVATIDRVIPLLEAGF